MDTFKILFFILMPLIYKILHIVVSNPIYENNCLLNDENNSFYYNKNGFWITHLILLIVYYVIEGIFIFEIHKWSGEWIFMNNVNNEPFELFAFFSIFFIISHLMILHEEFYSDINLPVIHLVPLIFLFATFMFVNKGFIKYNQEVAIFENMEYNVEVNTIYLEALSDTHTTTGDINGGLLYINGVIQDNYEIYYSFIDERDSVAIRHFPYSEENVEIYPQEYCPNPRIEFYVYSKTYKSQSDSYTKYKIYVPENTTKGLNINME